MGIADMRVAELMTRDVITLKEDESLLLAQDIMELGRIRHVPVVSGRRLVGLVTHRDILRTSLSSLSDATEQEDAVQKQTVPVREVMQTKVQTVSPETPAIEAVRMMIDKKYGCLPVVDDAQNLLGILSEADFLRLAERFLES